MHPVALIFGGTGGIGKAVASALVGSGFRVAITSRSRGKGTSIARNLIGIDGDGENVENRKPIALECNVTDEESVERCFQHVESVWAAPSVVVNAAGTNEDGLLIRTDVATMKAILETNLLGAIITSKMAVRSMLRHRSGSIINIGSVVGTCGNVGQSVYSASKAGLIGLTRSLAKEVAPKNIRVNLVSPGFIETPMTRKLNVDSGQLSVLLNRFGQPEEVAQVVKFLANATYITGQVVNVDGGLHLS